MFRCLVRRAWVVAAVLLLPFGTVSAQLRINIPNDVAYLDPDIIESGTTIDFWGSPSYGDAYISPWGESNSLELIIGSQQQEHVTETAPVVTDVTFNAHAGNPGLIKVASGGAAFFWRDFWWWIAD